MAHVLMPNWHPKNNQRGMVLIWMIVWLAGMAAILYWCVLKHIPAIEQRIESNAQTALNNNGHESIDVAVSDRIATLSGTVSSEAERSNIVDTVSEAEGVRSVNDELTLQAPSNQDDNTATGTETVSADNNDNIVAKAVIPATTEPADTNSDVQDTAAISSNEQAGTLLDNQNTTENSNAADSTEAESSKETANEGNAMSTADVTSTAKESSGDSQITVTDIAANAISTAEAKAADIENKANERIKAALTRQAQAETSSQQKQGTDQEAKQVTQTDIAAVPMLPPAINMLVDGNSLTITGDLSENDDALDLIESAMSTFDTPIVVNKIQVHNNRGAAPWLNELTGFLPAMQGIKQAGIRINQQQVVLSGEALSETDHDEVINQALSKLSTLSLVERIRVAPEQAPKETSTTQKELKQAEMAQNASAVKADATAIASKLESSGTIEDFFADYEQIKEKAILFESGSNRLTEDSVETVVQLATILNNHSNIKIGIDGHTDNSGQSDANLRLSQERSNAVRDTLIDQGVNVERINAYGFGDGVPIADNSTPEGRRLNRRIEFNFKLDQSR